MAPKGILGTLRMAASADEQFSTPEPLPASTHRPITASAARINLKSTADVLTLRNRIYTEWQNDAWAYFDSIGEIKYAFTMASNVVSRIRLYPALNFEQDAVPVAVDSYRDRMVMASDEEKQTEAKKRQALPQHITPDVLDHAEKLIRELLTSASGGQSGFMRSFALNMLVAGECYVVRIRNQWSVRSSHELVTDQMGKTVLRTQRAGPTNVTGGIEGDIPLPQNSLLFRIWREHPRHSGEPDSSMLSLREMCDEVITLQRMVRTTARSRMNAGLLFIPDGLVAAGSSIAEDVATEEEELDALTTAIYDSITAPVADETNAASVAPTIITGPGEAGKDIRYITIERAVDQFLVQRLDAAMGRILNGLDIPKDMVEGMSGVRYSNAQTMNGHMYQAQIEPLVLMLCDSLTSAYLRPMLKKQFPKLTDRDLDYFAVWYDPSEVVTKSDPTASADKGLEQMAISTDVWRRAHGFADSDAPSEKELAQRYLLMKAAPQPNGIDMLFPQAFPTVVDQARKTNLAKAQVPMPETAQNLLYGKVISSPEDSTVDGQNPAPTATETFNPVHGQATLPPELAPGIQGESDVPLPSGMTMTEAGPGVAAETEPAADESEPLQTEFDLDAPTEEVPVDGAESLQTEFDLDAEEEDEELQ